VIISILFYFISKYQIEQPGLVYLFSLTAVSAQQARSRHRSMKYMYGRGQEKHTMRQCNKPRKSYTLFGLGFVETIPSPRLGFLGEL